MKRENISKAMDGVGEHLIVEAAEKLDLVGAPVAVKAGKKGQNAFVRFMNSGWGVAAVCALVAIGVMGGIIWAGNQPGTHLPAGATEETETEAEVTEPLVIPETEETTAEEANSGEATSEEVTTQEIETEPPHEHILGEWSFAQTPTCTESGVWERRCTVEGCDAVEAQNLPAGLHDFKGTTCILCGTEKSPLDFTSNGDGTCYVSGRGDWALNSTELVIPNYSANGEPVVAIDTVDFQEMRLCSKVVLPEGLKSICSKAFYYSQHLAEVNIPAGVTYIGDEAFYNCIIESMELPEGLIHIGSSALCGNRFKEIYLPASLTHIGISLLSFSSVETVIFGEGFQIDKIPQGFAMMCREMKEISIPEGVTAIEDFAFWDSGLTAVKHMPESLTSIGVSAFADCPNLSELSLPASLTFVGDRAFANAPNLPYKVYDNVCYLPVGDNPYGVLVKLKSEVSGVTVHEDTQFLMGQAFLDCYSLIAVSIRGNITTIGNSTFKNCTSLRAVSIYAPVTSIGEDAFYGCEILQEVNLPNTLTFLGANAFYNCAQLTVIKLPAGITTIENGTFYGCVRLSNVTLPESVMSIGDQAFYRCCAITEMNLPKGVTSIGNEAFWDCNQMAILTMPDRLTYLGERAFCSCQALVEIEIPEGITSIGVETLGGCTSLKRVVLPDGLERLEENAFAYSIALESVSLPNTVTFIDRAFVNSICGEIDFRGTIAEWEAIGKRARWYGNNKNMVIHCTDGDVGVE